MSERLCYFQIPILATAADLSCTSLPPWSSKSLKKPQKGWIYFLQVNGTVMTFRWAQVEICLKSQKPVNLKSSFRVHLFFFFFSWWKGSMDWFPVEVRAFSPFWFSRSIIKMYWRAVPALVPGVGEAEQPFPQPCLNPNLSSLISPPSIFNCNHCV